MKRPRKILKIGVDLGGTNVRSGLVENDKVVKLSSKAIRSQGSQKEVFEDLCATLDEVFSRRVQGIGVGVPTLVDPKNGVLFNTANIRSWKRVPLRQLLEKRYGVPVRIDNDANCFALGEKYFGAHKNCEDFVGLILGTGLGAGIISRGHLHSGVDCGAGEFGSIPYLDSIVEHYASGQFFKGQGEKLAQAALNGQKSAQRKFNEFGRHLAFAIQVILYSVAPERIVLGGSVSQSYSLFKEPLWKHLKPFAYPTVTAKLKITVSTLRNSAVLGAASLLDDKSGA